MNNLDALPSWCGEFGRLQAINLRRNKFREVPTALKGLSNLCALDMGENYIDAVPSWVGDLQELQVLKFDGNRLSKLPSELGELIKLRRLDASFNRIRTIGTWLAKCSATIQHLHLD